VDEDFDSIFASFSLARDQGCHPPQSGSITPFDEIRGEIPEPSINIPQRHHLTLVSAPPVAADAGGRPRFLDKEKVGG
jgi:hypothetical protein